MKFASRIRRLLLLGAREEGAAGVETALSCTILLAILFGICQMSMAMYVYQFTSDASRQATRWAMVRGSTSCINTPGLTSCNAGTTDITNYVKGLGFQGITSGSIVVTLVRFSASSGTP